MCLTCLLREPEARGHYFKTPTENLYPLPGIHLACHKGRHLCFRDCRSYVESKDAVCLLPCRQEGLIAHRSSSSFIIVVVLILKCRRKIVLRPSKTVNSGSLILLGSRESSVGHWSLVHFRLRFFDYKIIYINLVYQFLENHAQSTRRVVEEQLSYGAFCKLLGISFNRF
jgi:hypothetical protein